MTVHGPSLAVLNGWIMRWQKWNYSFPILWKKSYRALEKQKNPRKIHSFNCDGNSHSISSCIEIPKNQNLPKQHTVSSINRNGFFIFGSCSESREKREKWWNDMRSTYCTSTHRDEVKECKNESRWQFTAWFHNSHAKQRTHTHAQASTHTHTHHNHIHMELSSSYGTVS